MIPLGFVRMNDGGFFEDFMKMRHSFQIVGVVFILVFSGCKEKETNSPPVPVHPSNTANDSSAQAEPHPEHPAADTARNFFEAIQQGDEVKIRSLLTPLARKKGEENSIPFSPNPSKTAYFTVDQAVPKGEIGAYVHSTLNDVNEQGQKESVEIIWIVARSEEGWRIAGAAVALFEGQEKTVINFEDPEAALKSIADAEQREVRRRKETEYIKQVRFTDRPYR